MNFDPDNGVWKVYQAGCTFKTSPFCRSVCLPELRGTFCFVDPEHHPLDWIQRRPFWTSTQHLLASTASKLHICCSSATPLLIKPTFQYINIHIIDTPNLGVEIVSFDKEKEQNYVRGSTKGARGRSKRALREQGRAPGSRNMKCEGAAGGCLNRGLVLTIERLTTVGGYRFSRCPQLDWNGLRKTIVPYLIYLPPRSLWRLIYPLPSSWLAIIAIPLTESPALGQNCGSAALPLATTAETLIVM